MMMRGCKSFFFGSSVGINSNHIPIFFLWWWGDVKVFVCICFVKQTLCWENNISLFCRSGAYWYRYMLWHSVSGTGNVICSQRFVSSPRFLLASCSPTWIVKSFIWSVGVAWWLLFGLLGSHPCNHATTTESTYHVIKSY